ncbi:MAG: DM13 domain-containing protein [Chloroflexota bacterium]|nr:DM13 domain-containing protein [Chloroflexota bacterium]
MLRRPLRAVRASRALQIGVIVAALLGAAFAWYTLSPFFITTTLVETRGAAVSGSVVRSGQLQRVDSAHFGTGTVALVDESGKRFARFEGVAIQNGPDLHVYLGRGRGGAYDGQRDLYLGALKATNGTFTYEIPAGTDLASYRSMIVWCRNFATLFTWADLE